MYTKFSIRSSIKYPTYTEYPIPSVKVPEGGSRDENMLEPEV